MDQDKVNFVPLLKEVHLKRKEKRVAVDSIPWEQRCAMNESPYRAGLAYKAKRLKPRAPEF